MPLTPIDVQQKTFATALRGYDLDEVDDFLDQVVTSLNDYEQRLSDAKDRISALEAEAATKGDDESAISRALVTAQRSADKLVADAEADATRIRADAEADATRVRDQASAEAARISEEMRAQTEALEMDKRAQRSRLEAEISAMSRGVGELRDKVRGLLRDIDGNVAEMEGAIETATPAPPTPDTPEETGPGSSDWSRPSTETTTIPGPGPVPVDRTDATDSATSDPAGSEPAAETPGHDQLDLGRIERESGDGASMPPERPESSAEVDPDAEDPVHRAEEQLVAEMSADVDDLPDDEPEGRGASTGGFDGGDYLDDGEFERVRRPWESD